MVSRIAAILVRRAPWVLAVSVALSLSLGVALALAAGEPHPFLSSFGSFSNPNGIAVDEATGDVYVADMSINKVYKFDASGKPVNFSSLGSNELSGPPAGLFSFPAGEEGEPAALGVDNSTDPSDPSRGDLYVMDAGHDVIDKFSPDGTYLGQVVGPFLEGLYGLGVDAKGNLRVFVKGGLPSGQSTSGVAVDVFDDAVKNDYVSVLVSSNTGGDEANFREIEPEHGFAVGPSDDDYMLYSGCGCLEKLGPNMAQFGRLDSGGMSVAAAVDSASGHVYVDDRSSISEWDGGEMNGREQVALSFEEQTMGTELASFGSIPMTSNSSGQGGIAVNGMTGLVYVSNPHTGEVDVFSTVVPAVAASAATDITKTTATLNGEVDPRGEAITSCKFEYGAVDGLHPLASDAYGHKVQCTPTATEIGSGTSPVAVSAHIEEGLQAGLLYHFRLVAGRANGSSSTSGLFATAGPGFGIKPGGFEVSFLNEDGTPDTQAGSHPFRVVTNLAFNTRYLRREPGYDSPYSLQPDGNFKDVIVDLPPGFVGNPNATGAKCTLRQLETEAERGGGNGGEECPLEAIVGELEVEFGDKFGPHLKKGGFANLREPIYNMVPPHGVAAQFGAHFTIPNAFINFGVQAGEDYPVQGASLNAPAYVPVITTRLSVLGVVGKCAKVAAGATGTYTNDACTNPGNGEFEMEKFGRKPFLTLPTGCTGPLHATIKVDSWQHPGEFVERGTVTTDAAGQPIGLGGCSKLLFPAEISVAPDSHDASTSSGLTVHVKVPQKGALNPDGFAESALRDTTVTLPEGVALNPSGADGLEACSEGLVGYKGFKEKPNELGVKWATFAPDLVSSLLPGVSFCPNGSKIGTVQIKTPLLPNPLEGAVYLAEQDENPFGSLVAMYLVAEDPVSGTLIKLAGEVKLSDTGQIVTTFANTPDLPFEDLEIHFFGGERAPLATPSRCGLYTTEAEFTPWDGNGPVRATSSFEIDHGPHGGPCPGTSLPFNPSLTAGTTNIQAGAFSPFTMTMSREDGQQNLQSIDLKMPPGLSGDLTGVELCPEAQANVGTCGPNSLIGGTTVSVGVGNDPFSVQGGKVYLTGPYEGAPFGLSIVNPAKAGPYDLEKGSACDCVVVRAKIEVDPLTAALTVTSDSGGPYRIPTILDGIPLQIKHVNVTITRPSFTFNPTNCEKLAIGAELHSAEGAAQSLSVPFQATNCARLSFKPQFKVSTSGRTSRHRGASLHVELSYPKLPFGSQANIHSVKVQLPRQLPSRLETLNKACVDSVFEANPAACPPASRVGQAKAITPILPVPLEGPAYFVSHGGAKFPELIVVLQGYGVTIDLHGQTFISEGITTSTFQTVPDVPVGMFELTLPQGRYSALAANGNLCRATHVITKRRRVRVKVHGRWRTVTKRIHKRIVTTLKMPTVFIAQNGMTIHGSTPIKVTGCAKNIRHGKRRHNHKQRQGGKNNVRPEER